MNTAFLSKKSQHASFAKKIAQHAQALGARDFAVLVVEIVYDGLPVATLIQVVIEVELELDLVVFDLEGLHGLAHQRGNARVYEFV